MPSLTACAGTRGPQPGPADVNQCHDENGWNRARTSCGRSQSDPAATTTPAAVNGQETAPVSCTEGQDRRFPRVSRSGDHPRVFRPLKTQHDEKVLPGFEPKTRVSGPDQASSVRSPGFRPNRTSPPPGWIQTCRRRAMAVAKAFLG